VLINILENACKFTPKGGEIQVRGRPYFWDPQGADITAGTAEYRKAGSREPNSYRIDIRDSGPRIPQEHLTKIFEEYTTYGGGPDRSGGGLGLAICKMILGSHGGRVWAENSDFGPRFSFVLPLGNTEAEATGDGGPYACGSPEPARREQPEGGLGRPA
jgi:signal transduction histidine kinase